MHSCFVYRAKFQADELRSQVYNITTAWQEFLHWTRGLSNRIAKVVKMLHSIRGEISVRFPCFPSHPKSLPFNLAQ